MTETHNPAVVTTDSFPFSKADLRFWIVKRTDGMITKFNIVKPGQPAPYQSQLPASAYSGPSTSLNTRSHTPLHHWCDHTPKQTNCIMEEQGVKLWVADSVGLKAVVHKFDYALDCGQIIADPYSLTLNNLIGDPFLCEMFKQYSVHIEPRLLKVAWPDREAPPLEPGFFKAYFEYIVSEGGGNVVVACQGGHGRSGSSAVMGLMTLIPDYTPFMALCHLRALHCPRAIESKVQHEYLGKFGEFLGRENDIDKAKGVKSFKEEFLALKVPGAEKYQAQLEKGNGALLDSPERIMQDW